MSHVIVECRNAVAHFAMLMETVLRRHDKKKRGWRHLSPGWLMHRLEDEVKELRLAVDDYSRRRATREDVEREAADVANFAMMIVDVIGQDEP